jgi:hypothetical protein
MDGGDGIFEGYRAEDGAERGSAEAEDGNLQAGIAERTVFHGFDREHGPDDGATPWRIFADP